MIFLDFYRKPLDHPVTSQIKMIDMSQRKPVPVLSQPPIPGESGEASRRTSLVPSRPETATKKEPKYSPVTFEEVAKRSLVNSPRSAAGSARGRREYIHDGKKN